MYSLLNEDIEAKYEGLDAIPSDEEYGRYIMREVAALGFTAKQQRCPANSGFIFTIELFGGRVKAAFLCKSNPKGVSRIAVEGLKELVNIKGASLYGIITTNSLLGEKARMYYAKGYFPYGCFNIGSNIMNVLTSAGIVTNAMGDFIKDSVAEMDVPFEETFNTVIIETDEAAEKELEEVKKAVPDNIFAKYEAGECDDFIDEALKSVCDRAVISAGTIAKSLGVPMKRANKLLDEMAELGVISSANNGKPRRVLLTRGMIEKRFNINVYDDDIDWGLDDLRAMYG